MRKISIIIPVFNAACYLHKCLDSCVNQTIDNYEIIIIDDCSKDNSREIIENYATKYNFIKTIFLTQNIRQGGARNIGLSVANGEYVAFVDSDDWVENDMFEQLYNAANGADMIGCNYYISTNSLDIPVQLNYDTCEFTEEKRLSYVMKCGLFPMRIYNRSFLRKNKLFFPEKVCYEDAFFNFLTALYARNVVHIDRYFYHYYQSDNSTVRQNNVIRQYERIFITDLIWDESLKRNILKDHRTCIEYKYLQMMAGNILYICLEKFDIPDRNQLSKISESIKYRIPKYRKTDAYKLLSSDSKRYIWLVTHSIELTIFWYKHKFDILFEYLYIFKKKLKGLFNNADK